MSNHLKQDHPELWERINDVYSGKNDNELTSLFPEIYNISITFECNYKNVTECCDTYKVINRDTITDFFDIAIYLEQNNKDTFNELVEILKDSFKLLQNTVNLYEVRGGNTNEDTLTDVMNGKKKQFSQKFKKTNQLEKVLFFPYWYRGNRYFFAYFPKHRVKKSLSSSTTQAIKIEKETIEELDWLFFFFWDKKISSEKNKTYLIAKSSAKKHYAVSIIGIISDLFAPISISPLKSRVNGLSTKISYKKHALTQKSAIISEIGIQFMNVDMSSSLIIKGQEKQDVESDYDALCKNYSPVISKLKITILKHNRKTNGREGLSKLHSGEIEYDRIRYKGHFLKQFLNEVNSLGLILKEDSVDSKDVYKSALFSGAHIFKNPEAFGTLSNIVPSKHIAQYEYETEDGIYTTGKPQVNKRKLVDDAENKNIDLKSIKVTFKDTLIKNILGINGLVVEHKKGYSVITLKNNKKDKAWLNNIKLLFVNDLSQSLEELLSGAQGASLYIIFLSEYERSTQDKIVNISKKLSKTGICYDFKTIDDVENILNKNAENYIAEIYNRLQGVSTKINLRGYQDIYKLANIGGTVNGSKFESTVEGILSKFISSLVVFGSKFTGSPVVDGLIYYKSVKVGSKIKEGHIFYDAKCSSDIGRYLSNIDQGRKLRDYMGVATSFTSDIFVFIGPAVDSNINNSIFEKLGDEGMRLVYLDASALNFLYYIIHYPDRELIKGHINMSWLTSTIVIKSKANDIIYITDKVLKSDFSSMGIDFEGNDNKSVRQQVKIATANTKIIDLNSKIEEFKIYINDYILFQDK